jgi:hypothetical protein
MVRPRSPDTRAATIAVGASKTTRIWPAGRRQAAGPAPRPRAAIHSRARRRACCACSIRWGRRRWRPRSPRALGRGAISAASVAHVLEQRRRARQQPSLLDLVLPADPRVPRPARRPACAQHLRHPAHGHRPIRTEETGDDVPPA